MTIAAGVMCPDGIILCADSQETSGQYKIHKPKLVELPLLAGDDLKAVIVASGDGPFIDMIVERISEALDLVDDYIAPARQAIETAVRDACGEIWPLYTTQADKPSAYLLIGLRAIDGLTLLEVPVPIVKTSDSCAFIGWGCDLANYKAKQLSLSKMPVAVAAPMAAYILEVVKENVEYCGGDTHLAIIHSASGEVEHKTQEYIRTSAKGYMSTAWALEAFIFPMLAVGSSPEGKSLLSMIAELGDPAADMNEKLAAAMSQVLENKKVALALDKGQQQTPQAEAGALSLAANPFPVALVMMREAEKKFNSHGFVSSEVHDEFQRRYVRAWELATQANAALVGRDLDVAKKLLRESVDCLIQSGIAMQMTPEISDKGD